MAYTTAEEQSPPAGRGERFVNNVLWGWLTVGVNLIVGLVLSRYIVRRFGARWIPALRSDQPRAGGPGDPSELRIRDCACARFRIDRDVPHLHRRPDPRLRSEFFQFPPCVHRVAAFLLAGAIFDLPADP